MVILEQMLGVNPFGKTVEVDKIPETIQQIDLLDDEIVQRTIEQYNLLKRCRDEKDTEQFLDLAVEILAPQKIQFVLLEILNKYSPKRTENPVTGLYLSKLIQASYDAGNNDFVLNISDSLVNIIGIKGTEKNPLHATIMGNACNFFGNNSENCIFDIEGDTQNSCGHESKNCRYNINGNTKDWCGYQSTNCYYNIQKNAQNSCGGFSKNSTFNIQQNTEQLLGIWSENCIYNIQGDAKGQSCGYKSSNSQYNINGNTGMGLGLCSKDCTYTIHGKVSERIAGDVQNSIFKVFEHDAFSILKRLPATNNIILLDKSGNIIKETKK